MGLILVIVFIVTFIIFNWIIEVLVSKNSLVTNTSSTYEIIKGEKSRRKETRYRIINKIDKKILKKILPIWLAFYIVTYLLFKSLLVAFVMSSILCFAVSLYKKIYKQIKRKEVFIYQFREALVSMSNSLKAGASLQVAIERCKNELTNTLRNQTNRPMLKELEILVNEINMGNNLSEVLMGFRERAQLEEVDNFVNAAIITEKTGGNLSEVMVNVCTMIGDRIQMKREIESLTAGKRSESRVLTIVPFIMIPLLATLSPSYLKPMYETLLGKVLMAFAVLLLVANFIIGKKIMDIKL